MAEYPEEYTQKFTLNNNKEITLRSIKPEDYPLEEEMINNFSDETKRYRFFDIFKKVSDEQVKRYTNIDYNNEVAIVAEIEEDKKKRFIGVVRMIIEDDKAEVAIVVSDEYQNQGLGNKFIDYIIEIAKKLNLKSLYANVLKSNIVMLNMFKKRGFKIKNEEKYQYAELIL